MEDIENHLHEKWKLEIKASSRACMAAAGSDETSPDLVRWPPTTSFECLGHIIQNDGGIRSCVSATKRSCWKAFWLNFSNSRAHKIPVRTKLALMNRAVTSSYTYRCSRWPAQRHIAKEFDKMQNKMTAIILRIPRLPGEQAHEYVKRRNHIASCQARTEKRWSKIWFSRVLSWHKHLERPHNSHSWPAQTLHYRGAAYLQQRRVDNCSASALGGRTRTRTARGVVHVRWHDGVRLASCQGE